MKNYLFIFIVAFAALVGSAQSFDETDLVGTWKVASATGAWNNVFESIGYIVFGDVKYKNPYSNDGYIPAGGFLKGYKNHDSDEEGDYWGIKDFLISNNNKLHIVVCDEDANDIRMVIKELDTNRMTLESYDGKSRFVLEKEAASVLSVSMEKVGNSSSVMYDLQGRQVERPHAGEIYIQGGQKIVSK